MLKARVAIVIMWFRYQTKILGAALARSGSLGGKNASILKG